MAQKPNEDYIQPVPGKVGTPFGKYGPSWVNTGGKHTGSDFPVPVGTPVVASNSGKVSKVRDLGNTSYGKYIEIEHDTKYNLSGLPVRTLYAHLSAINVSVGQKVSRGEVIGNSGETGNAHGAHVHFEMRVGGMIVDPMPYVFEQTHANTGGNFGDIANAVKDGVTAANPLNWGQKLIGFIAHETIRVGYYILGFALVWVGLAIMVRQGIVSAVPADLLALAVTKGRSAAKGAAVKGLAARNVKLAGAVS